jgi:hypothetical protein
VGGVLTRLFATHANILSSLRSTTPRGYGFIAQRMLSYHQRFALEILNSNIETRNKF